MEEHYYISSTKYSLRKRATKKHGEVYDVHFRVIDPGTREERQKKLSGYPTKRDAREAYTEFVTKYCELKKGYAIRNATSAEKAMTVSEIYPLFIASKRATIKESSIFDIESVFKYFVFPYFAEKRVQNITQSELYKWQDTIWQMRKPNGSPYSYSRLETARSVLSSFLTWYERRYNFPNPMRNVSKPKRRAPKSEMLFWTREEFDRFIECVDEPKYRALFAFLFFTGKRKGEALALSPADVDLTKKTVKINKSLTKKTSDKSYKITSTKAERKDEIPLCDPLVNILSEYTPGNTYYFEGQKPDTPMSENAVIYAFNKAIEKAGVKKIRIHDLRHSFVSMLIHLGANLFVVADLVGDTTEQITKTYGHLYQEDKQTIIARIK